MAASLEKHPNSNANKKSCPSQSELFRVEEGEQAHVCASLKMPAMKISKGMRVYVVEQPPSCGHGVK
jgi:hypothetical protein